MLVDLNELNRTNSAIKVGKAMKNLIKRVEFVLISSFYIPFAENSLTGYLAMVYIEVRIDTAESTMLYASPLQ
jgi:hypothetical protein